MDPAILQTAQEAYIEHARLPSDIPVRLDKLHRNVDEGGELPSLSLLLQGRGVVLQHRRVSCVSCAPC